MSDSPKAIFLSYASQDAEAAQRICEALRAAGLEVWFDRNELVGGDVWDQKIRKQIKECALFVPIISANTNARAEGYFRLEWKLAVDRSHLMADDQPFLFPIVVGDVNDATARVPDKFREVQWTRLRLDETPAELAARVTKLLSGEALEAGRPRPADRGEAAFGEPALQRKNRKRERPVWLRHAWSVLALAIVGYYALRPLWRERRSEPETVSVAPASPVVAAPKPSEAHELVTKARALFVNRLDTTRDDCALAEDLLKQALAKDPADSEAWAATSHLHAYVLLRRWDNSDVRRESARQAAQRAVRLDAQSFEARLAYAFMLGDTEAEGAEKERLLRSLRGEQPKDQRLLRALAQTLNRLGRIDEATTLLDESAALPGGDALALYDKSLNFWFAGRTVEAEAAIQASLAQRPFTGAQLIAAWYAVDLHGDLAGARALLARIPPAEMQEDRAAFFAYYVEKLARQPDAAIARLQAVPRDWLDDAWYRGPKARLVGDVLHAARRPAAAAGEWRLALRQVDERLEANPTEAGLLIHRAQLLARLGEKQEALRLLGTLSERYSIDPVGDVPVWVTNLNSWLGRKQDALAQISRALKSDRRAVNYTAASLRLDPSFDPLREEPGFAALIAEADRIEQAAALAARPTRDWPKNPELKRAIALIEGLDAIPDDLALAEQIVKPIVERSPTDLEAVTVMARVQAQFMRRGFDRSDERSAQARLYGERALQLDPNEPEAMFAVATYLFSRATGDTRAERLLRRAMEVDPANPRPGRMLADLLNVIPSRRAEAIVQSQENVRRFPNDALTRYDLARHYKDQGRYEESDRELDATLALAPLPNAIAWKARFQFGLRNDLAGMKRWLDQVPERVRGTERAVFGYFLYAAFGGDAETGLAALRSFTLKWFTDFEYAGPTALLNACLLERQGKTELARQQYEAALLEAQRMKVTDPTRIWLNHAEFWPLLGLGRKEEAKLLFQRLIEAQARPYSQSLVNGWWFTLIPGALLLGERDTALELLRESVATLPESRASFRVRFQLDPRMAPFRDDPEIQAILAEPGVK
ncbi:toll/interleukin-1 receptor domain-containing protein [Oleiharenicola lentus]|nr:toll/interleukin-1 receptor domain-containing protein [Oleiharenicola lentus]